MQRQVTPARRPIVLGILAALPIAVMGNSPDPARTYPLNRRGDVIIWPRPNPGKHARRQRSCV